MRSRSPEDVLILTRIVEVRGAPTPPHSSRRINPSENTEPRTPTAMFPLPIATPDDGDEKIGEFAGVQHDGAKANEPEHANERERQRLPGTQRRVRDDA